MSELNLGALVGLTLRRPAEAAQQILDARLAIRARWTLAVLVVSLASILAWVASAMIPGPDDGSAVPYGWIASQPVILAAFQLGALTLTAALIASIGRLFGGQGRFDDALILTVWIEAMLVLVQVVQVVLLPIAPGLATMLGFSALGLFAFLTVQFTKVLHGFSSGWKVLIAMIGTMFALGFLLSFIAAAFGLLPEVPA